MTVSLTVAGRSRSTPVSWRRGVLNVLLLAVFAYGLWLFLEWSILDAVWLASSRGECLGKSATGACWASIREWAGALLFGFYPVEERWRMQLLMLFIAMASFAVVRSRTPAARLFSIIALVIAPLTTIHIAGGYGGMPLRLVAAAGLSSCILGAVSCVLPQSVDTQPKKWASAVLLLGVTFAMLELLPQLTIVPTQKWGGFSLTLMIAFNLVAWGMPLGIIMALGRQSQWQLLSAFCTILIETLRALPLVLVLISFSIILPLMLGSAGKLDLLLRASLGLLIFTAAYFAEIVRAGLRAIPRGQTEAASALGLGYWQQMALILLPQALRLMTPALLVLIANTIKDTALLSVIGLFDLMNIARAVGQDRNWLGTIWEPMLAAAAIYLALCLAISIAAERKAKIV